MKTPNDIESQIILRNNTPIDDFLGLSPNEMNYLLYDTFGDKSPIQFRNDIDDTTLDQIPLFRIAEEFLKIIKREKHIKLTPLGALPKKVIVELYDKRFFLEKFIEEGIVKLWKEDDSLSIKNARYAAELAGLVKKANGKLTLTKTATKLLETNNRLQIFKQVFQAFTQKFNWGFNDGYPEEPIGKLGWAFSLMMLEKFGDHPQKADFYADKYLRAFPAFISFFEQGIRTPELQFQHCYDTRTFYRFFRWFGFATIETKHKIFEHHSDTYKRTDLVQRIFRFDA